MDWGSMLDDLDVAIEEARYKIREGRVRSPDKERVLISWCKCLAYCIDTRRRIAEDRDLEEPAAEVEELKAREGVPT